MPFPESAREYTFFFLKGGAMGLSPKQIILQGIKYLDTLTGGGKNYNGAKLYICNREIPRKPSNDRKTKQNPKPKIF